METAKNISRAADAQGSTRSSCRQSQRAFCRNLGRCYGHSKQLFSQQTRSRGGCAKGNGIGAARSH
ncbi:MAG TPA: hypothetical protein PL140_03350 [Ferrovaceae bacterium]|nr:hypothetical protein [Ferrovaceae bacterium]